MRLACGLDGGLKRFSKGVWGLPRGPCIQLSDAACDPKGLHGNAAGSSFQKDCEPAGLQLQALIVERVQLQIAHM